MTRMTRRAATAMPIPMPALAPVDMLEDALLTRFDMGKAFVGAIKRRARKDDVRPSIEDMFPGCGARVLRPAKHETG